MKSSTDPSQWPGYMLLHLLSDSLYLSSPMPVYGAVTC